MIEQNVELWKRELKEAGWVEVRSDIWECPARLWYRGPFQAWQLMKTHPELQLPATYRPRPRM